MMLTQSLTSANPTRTHRGLRMSLKKYLGWMNKAKRAWKWRLTKEYLFIFRHLSLCSTCVKQDVCSHYSGFIEDILVNGETRGVFEVRGVLWRYCSFYQEGRILDRGLKVKRL